MGLIVGQNTVFLFHFLGLTCQLERLQHKLRWQLAQKFQGFLPTVHHLVSTTYCPPPSAHYPQLPPTVHPVINHPILCPLANSYCRLPGAHCLASTVCHPLLSYPHPPDDVTLVVLSSPKSQLYSNGQHSAQTGMALLRLDF